MILKIIWYILDKFGPTILIVVSLNNYFHSSTEIDKFLWSFGTGVFTSAQILILIKLYIDYSEKKGKRVIKL